MTPKTETQTASSMRERILAAADDLFRKQGIRGIGVEALAEAAGTNKMTLYRYFESKDALIEAWVSGIIAQKDEEWKEMCATYQGDPQGHLREWSRRLAAKLAAMEARGSALHNAIAELPERGPPGAPRHSEFQVARAQTHSPAVRGSRNSRILISPRTSSI